MQNIEKPKKKIPLFPKSKTTALLKKYNGNAMLSDSSDDSDILEDSSDYEANEESNNNKIYFNNDLNNKINPIHKTKTFIDNANSLSPRKSIDDFKDIEEYVSKYNYDKNNKNNKNNNKIIENKNKNKKKEGKTPEKKKENKIINDIFINKEGDIVLSDKNKKETKNNQKSNNNNITNIYGALMEEDENFHSIFINQNVSIFNSKKELWKFQKILLDNQIIDFKSKLYM